MNAERRKTNPDHKARFNFGVTANCSCGWSSAHHYGKGARAEAAAEWRYHREKCEQTEKENGVIAA